MEFGPFRGIDRLGAGAVGEVWRAVHVATGDAVAIKRLHPEHAGRWASLLRREVEAVARLDHPGIVWIHDHGVGADGAPWVALELASGGGLDRVRPTTWSVVRDVLDELLPALQHAHARGVLHRDLKPANVLLCTLDDARPGPKLADFSLASVAGSRGPRGGTPDYLAPEQREGRFADEGPWTDLYALGGVAWALVCGGPPTTTPWSPRFATPPALEEWIAALRAPSPHDRFRSATAARAALRALPSVPGERSVGKTFEVGPDERPRRHPKRMPASLALLGLRPVPLVGRSDERRLLQALARGLAAADPAAPRVVRLVGGPGTGKSALVRWIGGVAAERDAVDVVSWGPRGRAVVAGLRALARGPEADRAAPSPGDPLGALLAWVSTARRPVLVLADPWEPDEVALLHAAAALAPGRVAVVAAAREAPPIGGAVDVALPPHPELAEVARAVGVGDPALIEAIARSAAGNAGAAVAIVRDLAGRGDLVEGPDGWRLRPGAALPEGQDVATRVPEHDRPALTILALLDGLASETEWAAACAGCGVAWEPAAVERFRRTGLVVDPDRPRLADEVLRTSLATHAEGVPDWLAAAAEALTAPGDPLEWAAERAARVGVLWSTAGRHDRALRPLVASAARVEGEARCLLLLERARRAAEAAPPEERAWAEERLRWAEIVIGSNHGHHDRAAAATLARLGAPGLDPRSLHMASAILLRAGYPHHALGPARRALAGFPPPHPTHEQARHELARIAFETGRFDECGALATGDGALAATLRALVWLARGDPDRGEASLADRADGPVAPGVESMVWVTDLVVRVEQGRAGWEEADAAWADPRSLLTVHVRVAVAVVRLLAAARTRPEEASRAEADARLALAANPIRSRAYHHQLRLAAEACTGELARRITDLADGQLFLDGPQDEAAG